MSEPTIARRAAIRPPQVATGGNLRLIARTPDHPGRPLDVVEQLERKAADAPDAAAIVLSEGRVSYAALAASSRALAARLDGDPEVPVVLLGDFSPSYVAAQIACLRAGRPFVPIDPATTPLRIAQIVLRCGADVVILGDGAPAAATALLPQARTIALDALDPDGPPTDRSADRACRTSFIVFTSGSTGISKGVPHTDALLSSFFVMESHDIDLRPGDRMAVASPPGVIAGPIFAPLPLFAGAVLLMASDRLDAGRFIELLRRERATQLCCYVGLARALAGHPAARSAFASLRAVQIFGDVASAVDCAALHAVLPPAARVCLNYGCTESMPLATWAPPRGVAGDGNRIPLGTPAPGMELWMRVDPSADPDTPHGELLSAGPRTMRGYWRDEAATRRRLVPHPEDPGRFLLAIGDVVRLRPDGMLDFLGRIDNQIKLRGWRIEIEEIEVAARRVPGVLQAAVVPRRHAAGAVESLALHLVGSPAPVAVLAALREALPDHMVPATALAVEALPLTATGKIDRVRLAEIDRQMQEAAASFVAATDDAWPDGLHARIAAVIAEEAGCTRIAPEERANDTGFDSLQAVSIALRIEKQFAVSIEPDLLLSDQTMAAIVDRIATEARRTVP